MSLSTVTRCLHNLSKRPKTNLRRHLIRVHLRSFAGGIGRFQSGYLRFAPVVVLFFICSGFLPCVGTLRVQALPALGQSLKFSDHTDLLLGSPA
jgi:hypothetical protein